jgi:antitoxin HigA-1
MEADKPAGRPGFRPVHPGQRNIDALGMTVEAFAENIGTSRQTVHTIIAGRSALGAEMAVCLGRAFNVTPQFWLNEEALMHNCDCCKNEVHAVDEDGLCFSCEAVQMFAAMIECETDLDGNASVDLAVDLITHVKSRILERLLEDGAPVHEFIADMKVGLAKEDH